MTETFQSGARIQKKEKALLRHEQSFPQSFCLLYSDFCILSMEF